MSLGAIAQNLYDMRRKSLPNKLVGAGFPADVLLNKRAVGFWCDPFCETGHVAMIWPFAPTGANKGVSQNRGTPKWAVSFLLRLQTQHGATHKGNGRHRRARP